MTCKLVQTYRSTTISLTLRWTSFNLKRPAFVLSDISYERNLIRILSSLMDRMDRGYDRDTLWIPKLCQDSRMLHISSLIHVTAVILLFKPPPTNCHRVIKYGGVFWKRFYVRVSLVELSNASSFHTRSSSIGAWNILMEKDPLASRWTK